MKPNFSFTAVLLFFLAAVLQLCPKASYSMGHTYIVDQSTPYLVPLSYFSPAPSGGDTIKILSTRTHCLKFNDLTGAPGQPIVLINSGGQVNIADSVTWGALSFVNCKYIKVSGRGSADHYYGFRLSAKICALAFAEYSSDCEVENIEMHHTLFFGIYAKKDFGGNPPLPYPQFNNLIIHDNYIHHVEEGMYIGETKSPGMEFRHVRIFNNVVTECMREAIQVANCVEDIEVYNNIGFNTGLGGLYAQCNILQIGGNTIGRYYNNILIHAPENGIICMGSGDVEVFSNYSSDNNGVYIDNREFNIPHSSISFRNNFFRNIAGTEVILNANELNELHIANNLYNTPIEFAKPGKPAPQVWDLTANQLQTLDSIRFSIANGIFVPDSTNPAIYNGLGPIPGLGYQMNGTPVLDSIGTVMAIYGDTLSKAVVAHTPDNDILTFNVIDLPEFVQFTTSGNGTATLSFIATAANKGVYYPTIMVRDSSHNQFDRETFKLAVKDPNNHDPLLTIPSELYMNAVTKKHLNITATDLDGDPIQYTFTDLPGFVSFASNSDSAWLDFKPLLSDPGYYEFIITADDGFGSPNSANMILQVEPAVLDSGRVLYRVNCSGPELEDQPINWQFDNSTDPVYGSSFSYGTGSHSWKGTNTTGAPNNLFGPFRHYGPAPRTMGWTYPLPGSGLYKLNLFFAERSTEVNNNTTGTFSISAEDSVLQQSYNIYAESGYAAARSPLT
ncbi:MAG: right-handed parallel beta-helix repeat-containing protein [Bacteroidales bacterium]|nr:right-handed parallel beta-helix repeat-containing protein [Bacteroidales bacterium]